MPKKRIDPNTGAVIFTSTPEDRMFLSILDDIKSLKNEVILLKQEVATLKAKLENIHE